MQNRKVKCDRERPHCGQCKKHGIPMEKCIWVEGVASSSQQHQAGGSTNNNSNHLINNSANSSSTATNNATPAQWLSTLAQSSTWSDNLGAAFAEQNTQALLSRIASLEASLAEAGERLNGDAYVEQNANAAAANAWRDHLSRLRESGADDAVGQSEAERGMAADALAMIAQNHPHAGQAPSVYNKKLVDYKRPYATAPRFFDAVTVNRFPFTVQATADKVRDIIGMLPEDTVIDSLMETVKLIQTSGLSTGLSMRLVEMQLATLRGQLSFWEDRSSEAEVPVVDLSFLALLFVLMVNALEFSESADLIRIGLVTKSEEVSSVTEAWQATGEALLAMINFQNRPNLNILMAISASRQYHLSRGHGVYYLVLISTAIRLAQAMGIHRLGSAAEDVERWNSSPAKPDSPYKERRPFLNGKLFFPVFISGPGTNEDAGVRDAKEAPLRFPDRSHLVRETARKMWYHFIVQDYFASDSFDRTYHIFPGQYNTALPLNLDEDELPTGLEDAPSKLPAAKPEGQPTDSNMYQTAFRVSDLCRETSDAYLRGKLTQEVVLEMDTKWRQIFDELPVFLKLDGTSENLDYVRLLQAQRPYLASQRLITIEMIQFRLLCLHRPFLVLGHHEPKYAQNTRACVEAARSIIFCRQELENVNWAVQRFVGFRLHTFQAALVLAMHLMELAKRGRPEDADSQKMRDEVSIAMSFLAHKTAADGTPLDLNGEAHKMRGREILDTLLAEEKALRQGHPAGSSRGIKREATEAGLDDQSTTQAPDVVADLSPDNPINRFVVEQVKGSIGHSTTDEEFWEAIENQASRLLS